MLRTLARHCGSTALALSMHTHLVATLVWRWRRDPQAVESFLRRVVDQKLVLISTSASDWLNGTGKAERVDGGWRVTGRKIFGSGVPMGDYLITGAVYDDPEAGATVLHFPLSLKSEGVRILDTWHVMSMRGTGSHDIAIEGVLAEAAVFGPPSAGPVAPAAARRNHAGNSAGVFRVSRDCRGGAGYCSRACAFAQCTHILGWIDSQGAHWSIKCGRNQSRPAVYVLPLSRLWLSSSSATSFIFLFRATSRHQTVASRNTVGPTEQVSVQGVPMNRLSKAAASDEERQTPYPVTYPG